MQWSLQHQLIYALSGILILAVIGGGGWFLFFYSPPSCFDGILNQGEEGIDCGGSCSLICKAPAVSALWARSVRVAPGVYHAVAMVRNPESDAGTNALPYTFSLFDSENILIAERRGMAALQPGEVAPILEPNIITGERTPARTFITLETGRWQKMTRSENPIRVASQDLDQSALRLSASIENTSVETAGRVILTALLYSADEVLITASQTVIGSLPPRGVQGVVFTWQEPFSEPIVRADIIPRVAR